MEIRDQLDRIIQLNNIPKRIISLVPSQTELLVDLGLEKNIVGITHFCVHPKSLKKIKKRVGGTKKVNFRKVRELEPDIILCNKEENTKEMVEELEKIAPVHVSEVSDLDSSFELMMQYGKIFDRTPLAQTMVETTQKKAAAVKELALVSPKKKVAYFIWDNPLMVAGKGTFIDEMLKLNNFDNVFSEERYPVTSTSELEKMSIDLIMLSSEPFPFEEKHKEKFGNYANGVRIVDGEFFSWYGSRLVLAMDYFKEFH